MTDLLLPKKGTFRKLFIKKDEKLNFVMVEGATMALVDFADAKEFTRIYN
jgi:hypothetical protein